MNVKKKMCVLLFIIFIAAPACGMKKMATRVMGAVATDGMIALEGEGDVAFARESAPALIKTLEVLRHGDRGDRRSLVLLSRSYGQYTFGFLEEDLLRFRSDPKKLAETKARADEFYRRGREFGIAALAENGAMKNGFKAPFQDFKKAVDQLGKEYVPALFWSAFNWASYLNLHLDDPASVVDMPRIEAMIDRVIALDPGYYFGSANAMKGVIMASKPKMLGGDPAASRRSFDAAMTAAPGYLMTKVLMAQFLARQSQDRTLFQHSLNEVLKADAASLPAGRLANELAKRRAALLIPMEKELF